MATDLETRPDEDQDNSRIQQHYDQKLGRGSDLDDIANQEQQAATDSGSDAASESGGLYRDEGSGGSASDTEKTLSPNDPVNPEHGGLYSGEEDGKRGRRSRFLGFNISRRKGVTGGIIGLMLGGGMFFGFGIASGPLQVVHLGEILHNSFVKTEDDSSNRTRHLFRYARANRTGNIGETRVGVLGSKVFGTTITQLSDIGIEIKTGRAGMPVRTEINTDKLKNNFPELEQMSEAEQKAFIGDKIGVPADSIRGTGGSFRIEQTDMNIRASRLLTQNTVGLLDDGKITSQIKARTLTKVYNLPSLFHPIKKANASLQDRFLNGSTVSDEEKAKQAEADEKAALNDSVAGDKAQGAIEKAKSETSGLKSSAEKGLTLTGFQCEAHHIAGQVVEIDRKRVVLPSIVQAMRIISLGSQVKNGNDLTSKQVGAVVESFSDSKGKTIWQSKPLQILAGGRSTGLTDISDEHKQAFNSRNAVTSIDRVVESKLGGKVFTDLACSDVGTLTQIVGGLAITLGTDGTGTAVLTSIKAAGLFGANILKSAAISYAATNLITKLTLDKFGADALAKNAFSGPQGGSLYAYGSRAASVAQGVTTGGVPLGQNSSKAIAASEAARDRKEFESKSMMARIFDAKDYRSLLGRTADSFNPSMSQNITSFGANFAHVGSMFSGLFSSLTPRATADETTYDWGFSGVGIPEKLLNDPNLADPYANSGTVASLLDNTCRNEDDSVKTDCTWYKRITVCFGNQLVLAADPDTGDLVWDLSVMAGKDIDPNTDEYASGDCGNTNDEDWNRIVMFVNDTHSMKAAACYQGDEQSCTDLGVGSNASTEKSSGGADFRIASFNICYGIASDNTSKAACAGGQDFKPRLDKTVATIKSNGLDIVGLQEVRGPSTPNGDQYSAIQQLLPNYGIFPKSYSGSYPGQNPIIWDSSKFALVDGGSKAIAGYTVTSGPDNSANTQVRLKYLATGQEFYVINQHEPVGNGEQDAKWRTESAQARAKYIDELSKDGIPIFITGDFDSKYRVVPQGQNNWTYGGTKDNLAYCILTTSKAVQDAFDVSSGKPAGQCPSYGRNGGVDHIYMSAGVTATDYKYFGAGVNSNGSDHNTLSVHVTIPGSGAGGGQLRIATFNVLGAGHTGGAFETRANKAVNTITSNNLDVVGTQELRPVQRNYFVSKLTSYDNFPKGNDNSNHGIENSIFWNKTKFEYVDGGFEPGVVYFCGNGLDAPWVKLRNISTGQEFYVVNTHDPSASSSNPCSNDAARQRYENAKAHAAFLKKLQPSGLPMFFTGDFNSAYTQRSSGNGTAYQGKDENLTYCVMVSSGVVSDAYDVYRNRPFKCPNRVTNSEDRQRMEDIDHVYLSKGLSVTNWITVSAAKAGSDHTVEIFDVTMPGSSSSGETDIIKSLGIKKVLVVVEENHSLDQMKQGMPYTFSLAKQYGYTTNYAAIAHPSLPNYIAMAAGGTVGVTDDKEPSEHKLQGQTVFGQAISSGKTAKIYAESMSGNCDTTSGGKYLARHNPWAYFVDERNLCKQYDVPAAQFRADVTAGTLPNVGMLIPNRCNDAHDCSLATADNWFKGQMNTIMSGPDWKLGNLLVVLTADEDDKKSNNTVLTVLLNPNISSAVTSSALNHYSLSQLLSGVSGNAGLRNAKNASPITLPSNTIQKVASP